VGETALAVPPPERRLAFFERYLTLWVGLCMVAGVVVGKFCRPLSGSWLKFRRCYLSVRHATEPAIGFQLLKQ